MGHGGHGGGGSMGAVLLLEALSGVEVASLQLPGPNHNAVFSPDGHSLWRALMDDPGLVLILDAETPAPLDTLEVGPMPAEVSFSADGAKALIAIGETDSVAVFSAATHELLAMLSVGMGPVGAWPGADDRMYVDNESGMSLTVIDAGTLTVDETANHGFTPGMAAYHAGRQELRGTDSDNGQVVIYARSGGACLRNGEVTTGSGAHGVAFSGGAPSRTSPTRAPERYPPSWWKRAPFRRRSRWAESRTGS